MQEESRGITKITKDDDLDEQGYLTQQDNQALLIVRNKAKQTHLKLHDETNFKDSQTIALEEFPQNLIPTLE